jgi:hypothetical protein
VELDETKVVVEAQKALFNTFFMFDFKSSNDDSGNFDLSSDFPESFSANNHWLLAKAALTVLENMLDSDVG